MFKYLLKFAPLKIHRPSSENYWTPEEMKKFESFSKDKTPNRSLNFNCSEFESALKEIRASENANSAEVAKVQQPPEPSISENSVVVVGEATFPSVSSQTDIEEEPTAADSSEVETGLKKREGSCQTDDIDLESLGLDPLETAKSDDKPKVTVKTASVRPTVAVGLGQRGAAKPAVGRGRALPLVPSSPQPRLARSVSDTKATLPNRNLTKRPTDLRPRPTTAPVARTVSKLIICIVKF